MVNVLTTGVANNQKEENDRGGREQRAAGPDSALPLVVMQAMLTSRPALVATGAGIGFCLFQLTDIALHVPPVVHEAIAQAAASKRVRQLVGAEVVEARWAGRAWSGTVVPDRANVTVPLNDGARGEGCAISAIALLQDGDGPALPAGEPAIFFARLAVSCADGVGVDVLEPTMMEQKVLTAEQKESIRKWNDEKRQKIAKRAGASAAAAAASAAVRGSKEKQSVGV